MSFLSFFFSSCWSPRTQARRQKQKLQGLQNTVRGRVFKLKEMKATEQQTPWDVLQDTARQKYKPICQHELCIESSRHILSPLPFDCVHTQRNALVLLIQLLVFLFCVFVLQPLPKDHPGVSGHSLGY